MLHVLLKFKLHQGRSDQAHFTQIFLHIEFQENREIGVKQIQSSDNLADLFTKALPKSTFQKLVYGIGIRRLNNQTN